MALEINQPLLSYDDYMALPDGPLGEVIDGVFLMTPSPSYWHQAIAGRLFQQMINWLDDHPGVGEVAIAPLDVVLRPERPARVVQPDVIFIAAERVSMIQQVIQGAPDLLVEVVSPGSMSRDTITKRNYYEQAGVREYWIIWPDEARIDVLVANEEPQTYFVRDTLETSLIPGLKLDLAKLFRPVGGQGA